MAWQGVIAVMIYFFLDFTSMEKEYSIVYDQSSITTLSLMYLKLLFVVD